uniref:Uncharacterized protein n=1 Tax=Timema tahoe TaxID=61484 RepID=A0A7R9IE40_9NEOP|nr:unnamed protein product [Timema tahoe]
MAGNWIVRSVSVVCVVTLNTEERKVRRRTFSGCKGLYPVEHDTATTLQAEEDVTRNGACPELAGLVFWGRRSRDPQLKYNINKAPYQHWVRRWILCEGLSKIPNEERTKSDVEESARQTGSMRCRNDKNRKNKERLSDNRRNTNPASTQDSINSPLQISSNGYSKKSTSPYFPRLRNDAYDDSVYPRYQSSASPSYQETLRDDYQRKYVDNADLHQPVKSTGELNSAIRRVSMRAQFPQVDREEDTVASASEIQEDVSRVVFRDEEGDSEGDLGSIVEGRYYDSNLVRIKTPVAKSGAHTTHEQEQILLDALHHKMNDSDHPRGFDQGLAEMLEEKILRVYRKREKVCAVRRTIYYVFVDLEKVNDRGNVLREYVIPQTCRYRGSKFDCGLSISCVLAGGKPLDLCSGGMLWSCCVNKIKLEEHGDTTVGTLQNAMPHTVISMIGNGVCLFRAISCLLYDTQVMAREVREQIVSHVVANWEEFVIMSQDSNAGITINLNLT